jgi:hypothetical protein
MAFLVASYVAWGFGLRVNLAANWALLEDTGTSTSALSKAAYDIAGLGRRSERFRRIASQAGYVSTELAKEIPYYAGAFGAAFAERLGLVERRARVPRRGQPRGGGLRIRARPPHAHVPSPAVKRRNNARARRAT